MRLTDENQDDMDCRPLGRETGITATSEAVEKRIAELQAKAAAPSKKPTPTDRGEDPISAARK